MCPSQSEMGEGDNGYANGLLGVVINNTLTRQNSICFQLIATKLILLKNGTEVQVLHLEVGHITLTKHLHEVSSHEINSHEINSH